MKKTVVRADMIPAREKAIAVYQGLAETVMCVPYMEIESRIVC